MNSPKVLVADDSPLVLRMIEKMLTGAGIGVVTAQDGLEAIEKAFTEDVSLAILDVSMPRMTGYQACRLIKSEPATKDLPVVILTSRDQAGDRFWGLETGADYYITKDSEPQRILDLVKNILAGVESRPRPKPPSSPREGVDILSRVNELLDRKLYEATILGEMGRVSRYSVQFDETFTAVMTLVSRVVDFSVGCMAFVEGEELEVVLMLNRPVAAPVVEEAKARLLDVIARQREGQAFTKVQARLFSPSTTAGPEETILVSFASFPVVTDGQLIGLLGLGGRAVARVGAETEAFLAQVANQAHIVMNNSRLFERVRNLSVRDSLTGLFNHRHSIDLVANEFDRVGRYEVGVSVLMVDVDHFKLINDQHGHQVGDVVLREVARLIKETLRTVDTVGRYGGEEFLAILPHTDAEEALRTAERVRRALEAHVIRTGDRDIRVTVSIGVASYPSPQVESPAALIREADKALYRAKGAGRNRVE